MDSHSRLVGWLKVALPLLALALLSTVFLVARQVDPEAALPYAQVDIDSRLRDPRMTDATYSAVTSDGGRVAITAAEARSGPEIGSGASAARIAARLDTPDGAHTALTAENLEMQQETNQALLGGGVLVANSAGYELRTEALRLALDRSGAETLGRVEGFGPPGRITADRMEIRPATPGGTDYLMVFQGAVSLIYDPRSVP